MTDTERKPITENEPAISHYTGLMDEVKRRTAVITAFVNGTNNAQYAATTIECACLQLRKILELIAMASLVANKAEYAKIYDDFARTWNARFLLPQLRNANPHFYPRPIIETPSPTPGVKSDWTDKTSGFLTEVEFIKVYEKCGAIMHWGNPFGSRVDYGYYEQQLPIWTDQVIGLLNSHTIRLVDDPNLYLIHMQEDGSDRARYYIFGRKA